VRLGFPEGIDAAQSKLTEYNLQIVFMAELDGNVGAPPFLGEDAAAAEAVNRDEANESETETSLRMTLTADERRWALAIKAAIEQEPEVDNLSDFMYAQYGIICKGNVADAVDRAESLQWYRHNYGVAGSLKDGEKALRDMVETQPEVYLLVLILPRAPTLSSLTLLRLT
jgi:hypothetical protein